MSSILPKGIIVNTAGISSNIQKIDKEPLADEEIAKLWKVYTTTNRRLLDPTAERLENYWWRIWGSRKRNLRGSTVARLFVEISNGTTFAPLRGSPERDESRRGSGQTASLHHSSETAITTTMNHSIAESSYGQQPSTASNSSTNLPPPILKKTRGPSSTGPRPIARFISPHSSEGEDDNGSQSNTNCHVIIEPPTPDTPRPSEDAKLETQPTFRKKAHGIVATNTSHKRKPGTSRKPSSLSSTNSDTTSQRAIVSKGTSGRSIPRAVKSPGGPARLSSQSKSQENLSLSPEKKSGRKVPKRSRSVKIEQPKKSPEQKASAGVKLETALSPGSSKSRSVEEPRPSNGKLQPIGNLRDSPQRDGLDQGELREPEVQELLLTQAKSNRKELKSHNEDAAVAGRGYDTFHKVQRSRSFGDRGAILHAEHQFPKAIDAKSTVSLAPTYAAAIGKLNFRDELDQASVESDSNPSLGKGKGKGKEMQSSIFVKLPIQSAAEASALSASIEPHTMPDSSAMSRSKSQLTLLLEKDRARTTEHKGDTNAKLPSARGGDD